MFRRIPPMNREDELATIAAAQAGDRAAEDQLVCAQVCLIRHLAKPFRDLGEAIYEDVVSEGLVALVRAIRTFDASYGCRLSTHVAKLAANDMRDEFLRQRRIVGHASHKKELRQESWSAPRDCELSERNDEAGGARPDDLVIDADQQRAVHDELERAAARFGPRGRTIVALRYLGGETLASVGKRLGLTRERVRQIEAQDVLPQLRRALAPLR